MKINIIRIKNLNSLSSEITIDLSVPPVSFTGLFAITGDTGAGKTTILDAITLAMYGETARKQKNDILSYGAGDCYAEVEYETKGKKYRTKWMRRRARNKADGNLQSPEMELSCLNEEGEVEGAFIATGLKKGESVVEKNEELTGLNFDRFCRSVLLAQGDFAAFLKAKEKDRSDLLESITGTEIYSLLSRAAYKQYGIEKKDLEQLNTKIAELDVPTEEQLAAQKEELSALKKEGKDLEKEKKDLEKLKDWLRELERLKTFLAQLNQDKIAIEAQRETSKSGNLRLEKYRKAAPFQVLAERLKEGEERQNKNQLEQDFLLKEKVDLEEIKTSSWKKVEQAEFALKMGKEEEKKMSPIFKKVAELDTKIKAKKEPKEGLEEAIFILKNQSENTEKQLVKEVESLNENQKIYTDLVDWLKVNKSLKYAASDIVLVEEKNTVLKANYIKRLDLEKKILDIEKTLEIKEKAFQKSSSKLKKIAEEKSEKEKEFKGLSPANYTFSRGDLLEQLQKEIDNSSLQKSHLSQLVERGLEYQKLNQKLNTLEEELKSLFVQEDLLNTEVYNASLVQEELVTVVDIRREIFNQQSHLAALDRFREELKEGESCVVCGSESHPYLAQGFPEKAKEISKEDLEKAERALKDHKEIYQELWRKQSNLHNQIQSIIKDGGQKEALQKELAELEEKTASQRLFVAPEDFVLAPVSALSERVQQLEGKFNAIKENRQKLLSLDKQLSQLDKDHAKAQEETQKFTLDFNILQKDKEYSQSQLDELRSSFEVEQKTYLDLLAKYGYGLGVNESSQNALLELVEKTNNFSVKEENSQALKEKIVSNTEKKKHLEEVLNDFQKRLEKEEITLSKLKKQLLEWKEKREILFVGNIELKQKEIQENIEKEEEKWKEATVNLNEAQLSLSNKETQLASLQKELESIIKSNKKTKEELLQKLNNSIFQDLEDLNASFLTQEEEMAIVEQLKAIEKAEVELNKDWRETTNQLEIETAKALTDKNKEELGSRHMDVNSKINEILRNIGAFEEREKQQKIKQKQQKALLQKLEQQQEEANRWSILNEFIGSADGNKFRKFAQGLTLRQLVSSANKYLFNLHGRYRIYKTDGSDLDLEIEDLWQADSRRSMNTLSGGESFLVSLALALGLSDLAGRNTSIQSLFIDEGFGSLDEATLEDALNTLENLQARGKTIGIISHVKELKERISTQIQVRKKGSGFSEVTIVSV